MPTTYTSNLRLAKPATGELAGTWGTVVNDNVTTMIEQAITGLAAVSMTSDANYTLTVANGTTDESRCMFLSVTSTVSLTNTRNVICPTVSKLYVIKNGTTGSQSIVLKTSAGTGVTVPNGSTMVLYCDGTNVVSGMNYLTALTLGSALAVASGGTGGTSFTANRVLLGNGTSAFQEVAPGTNGNVLTSNGTTWTSAAPPAQSYPGAGIAVSTGSAWGTSKTSPTGDIVGTSDSQTLSAKTITGLKETRVAVSASNIDVSAGNYFTKTISGTTTFTVSNVPSTGTASSFILDLTNGGSATVNWWSGVKWPAGTAPTLTSSGRDSLGFYTYDGGTTWTGLVLGKDIK